MPSAGKQSRPKLAAGVILAAVAFLAAYWYRASPGGVNPLVPIEPEHADPGPPLWSQPETRYPAAVELQGADGGVCIVMVRAATARRVCMGSTTDVRLLVSDQTEPPRLYLCPASGHFYWTRPYLCTAFGDLGGSRVGQA